MGINDIKTGDILMVATDGWIGRAIRKVTKAEWSHAGLFIWIWGELFVIEAEKHGIQLTKFSDKKYNNGNSKGRKLLYLRSNDELISEKEIAMIMLPYVGSRDYDYKGLIDQLIYQYTGKWIGRKEKGDNKFYCSEFVAFIYNKINKKYYPKWWEISPGQIFTNNLHVLMVTKK